MTAHPAARVIGVIAPGQLHDGVLGACGLAHIRFDQGLIGYAAGIDVARDGERLCVAWGAPRFSISKHDELARLRGSAATWLAAFAESGTSCVADVRGRFAVAVASLAEARAWLACDRFGTWPICYSTNDARLAFSDRADSVPLGTRDLSLQALFDYFYFHVIPAPRTVYEGVWRLPAGSQLTWDGGVVTCEPYWVPRFTPRPALTFDEAAEQFRALVRASVKREATGRQVAAFLSGGTDSSTIAGLLCEVLGRPARTYSIGFDVATYDEMHYARIAARHFATDHHEHYVSPGELVDGVPRIASHHDQPFGNSSAIPAWICASQARIDGVERMLAGDGGDELFGGNQRYARQRMFEWYSRVPAVIRKNMLERPLQWPLVARLPLLRKAARYVEQARVPLPQRSQMHNLLLELGVASVLTPAVTSRINVEVPAHMEQQSWEAVIADCELDRLLGFEWKYTLADNDLPKVIGATQLAGVEVAFPLLADELVEFSGTLPAEWKVKGLKLRWFFKEALRGFLPDDIIAKRKHGFGMPFGVWVLQVEGTRRFAMEALDAFAERGVVHPEFLRRLFGELLPAHPAYYGEMVWIVVMLEHWMRAHEPHWRLEA